MLQAFDNAENAGRWVNKYTFMNLFTAEERARYRAAKRQAAALPAVPTTPEELALDQLADFLDQFDALPDNTVRGGVNLDDPALATALQGLFVPLGIITDDRVPAILANQQPA